MVCVGVAAVVTVVYLQTEHIKTNNKYGFAIFSWQMA